MGKTITLDNLRNRPAKSYPAPVKIMIGMLSPGSLVPFKTMESIESTLMYMSNIRWPDGSVKYKINWRKVRATNIYSGRNQLCQMALDAGADYVCMVDSDMVFPHDTLFKLLEHRKPVVSALAFRKIFPYQPVIGIRSQLNPEVEKDPWGNDMYRFDIIENWVDGALIEVDATGTAFLLIDMEVIRKIEKPWFYHHYFDSESGRHNHQTRELGSDYYFCCRVRNAGIPIYVDTSAKIGHIGEYIYEFKDWIACGGHVKDAPETSDVSTEYDICGKKSYRVATLKPEKKEKVAV